MKPINTPLQEEVRQIFETFRTRRAAPSGAHNSDAPLTLLDAFVPAVVLAELHQRAGVEVDASTLIKLAAASVPCTVEDMQLAFDTMTADIPLGEWVDAFCQRASVGNKAVER